MTPRTLFDKIWDAHVVAQDDVLAHCKPLLRQVARRTGEVRISRGDVGIPPGQSRLHDLLL